MYLATSQPCKQRAMFKEHFKKIKNFKENEEFLRIYMGEGVWWKWSQLNNSSVYHKHDQKKEGIQKEGLEMSSFKSLDLESVLNEFRAGWIHEPG